LYLERLAVERSWKQKQLSRVPDHYHANKGLYSLSQDLNIFFVFEDVKTSDRKMQLLLKHKGKHLTDLDS
jgi:hypothetical protein